MADIDQQEYRLQLFRAAQVSLNHFSPLGLHRLIGLRIAVARQIHQIEGIIDIVKINGLCLSRLGGGPCKGLSVHNRIDEGGFSHIALSCKSDFRKCVVRQRTCYAAYGFQVYIFNYHIGSFLPALFPAA